MSCERNIKACDSAWELFINWYEEGDYRFHSSWGDDTAILTLISEAAGLEGEEIGILDLEELFDELWAWDSKGMGADPEKCVKEFINKGKGEQS